MAEALKSEWSYEYWDCAVSELKEAWFNYLTTYNLHDTRDVSEFDARKIHTDLDDPKIYGLWLKLIKKRASFQFSIRYCKEREILFASKTENKDKSFIFTMNREIFSFSDETQFISLRSLRWRSQTIVGFHVIIVQPTRKIINKLDTTKNFGELNKIQSCLHAVVNF